MFAIPSTYGNSGSERVRLIMFCSAHGNGLGTGNRMSLQLAKRPSQHGHLLVRDGGRASGAGSERMTENVTVATLRRLNSA